MGYYKGKYQHDGLTTTLKRKGRMTLFRFGGLVVLFGGCLNLIQTARRLRKPRPPVYSSLRNLKSVDYSTMRKLVTVIENEPEGENCRWVEPEMVNQTEDLFSTILVAYPGSGKRAAFLQLEGLTQLLTQDDWSLNDRPKDAKYAFIKTQYPHHEGVWAWGAKGNQTIYVLQNPRTALQTYMFLLHEINYSTSWWDSYTRVDKTFTLRPNVDEWQDFKNARFFREIHGWSWHLEFWMENGLFRDIFTHEITTTQKMDALMNPSIYTEAELIAFETDEDIDATWDHHCDGGKDMVDCRPVAMVSYEKIIDPSTGPLEIAKMAAVIQGKKGIDVVQKDAWKCVWNKVVALKETGVRLEGDREGPDRPEMEEYVFTEEEVLIIIGELNRLRTKYSAPTWQAAALMSSILVEYLDEYIADQYAYLAELSTEDSSEDSAEDSTP